MGVYPILYPKKKKSIKDPVPLNPLQVSQANIHPDGKEERSQRRILDNPGEEHSHTLTISPKNHKNLAFVANRGLELGTHGISNVIRRPEAGAVNTGRVGG